MNIKNQIGYLLSVKDQEIKQTVKKLLHFKKPNLYDTARKNLSRLCNSSVDVVCSHF